MVDALYTDDVVDHSAPPGLPAGIDGARAKVGAFIEAFPDFALAADNPAHPEMMAACEVTSVEICGQRHPMPSSSSPP